MSRVRDYAPAALVLVLGLVLWEAVVVAFSIEFYLLPAPHVIVASLQETYPVLVEAGLYTFTEAILGYALGCGGGILAAMVASQSPTFVSTLRGLLSVAPQSLELMRSYAASEQQIFWKLRLPSSLPMTFTALRACATLAMIGAVVSEFFGGPVKSLGVYIKSTASLFQTRQAWSAILVACALGLLFYFAVALVERLVMPWHFERSES